MILENGANRILHCLRNIYVPGTVPGTEYLKAAFCAAKVLEKKKKIQSFPEVGFISLYSYVRVFVPTETERHDAYCCCARAAGIHSPLSRRGGSCIPGIPVD